MDGSDLVKQGDRCPPDDNVVEIEENDSAMSVYFMW